MKTCPWRQGSTWWNDWPRQTDRYSSRPIGIWQSHLSSELGSERDDTAIGHGTRWNQQVPIWNSPFFLSGTAESRKALLCLAGQGQTVWAVARMCGCVCTRSVSVSVYACTAVSDECRDFCSSRRSKTITLIKAHCSTAGHAEGFSHIKKNVGKR